MSRSARDLPSLPRLAAALDRLLRRAVVEALELAARLVLRLSRPAGLLLAGAGLWLLQWVQASLGRLDFPSVLVFSGLGIVATALGALRVGLPTPGERIARLQRRFALEDRRRQGAHAPQGPTWVDIVSAPTPFHVCTRCRVVTSGAGLCDCCLCGTGIVPVLDESDRRTALVAVGAAEPDDGVLSWAELDALVPG